MERQQRVMDARDKLYREGYMITGDHVDGVLKDKSLVPTQVRIPLMYHFHFSINPGLEFLQPISVSPQL